MQKSDPVVIVRTHVEVLAEAMAVMFAFGVTFLWIAIYATRVPV